jgi:hypothetical protein
MGQSYSRMMLALYMYELILPVMKAVGETLMVFRESNAVALRNAAF